MKKSRDNGVLFPRMTSILWKTNLKTWVVFKQGKQHQTLFLHSILAEIVAPQGYEREGKMWPDSLRVQKETVLVLREVGALP